MGLSTGGADTDDYDDICDIKMIPKLTNLKNYAKIRHFAPSHPPHKMRCNNSINNSNSIMSDLRETFMAENHPYVVADFAAINPSLFLCVLCAFVVNVLAFN